MKVILTANGCNRYGGIPKYNYLLAIELQRKGIDVELIVDSELAIKHIKALSQKPLNVTVIKPVTEGISNTIKYTWNVSKYLQSQTFDILHSNHITPYFYLMGKHEDIVFQPFGNELFTLAGKGLNRAYCKLAQRILASCGHNANVLLSEGKFQHKDMEKWYGRKDIKVLPVGVNTKNPKIDYKVSKKTKLITVNNLVKYEHMDKIIELVKIIPDIELIIVGKGELESKLKYQAKGLPVKFFKDITEKTLDKLYCNADAYISPSGETDYQMGVLEAMATGLPIISQPNEWLPEETIQGNLQTGVQEFINMNEVERKDNGELMRKKVELNSFNNIANKAIVIYAEAMSV